MKQLKQLDRENRNIDEVDWEVMRKYIYTDAVCLYIVMWHSLTNQMQLSPPRLVKRRFVGLVMNNNEQLSAKFVVKTEPNYYLIGSNHISILRSKTSCRISLGLIKFVFIVARRIASHMIAI